MKGPRLALILLILLVATAQFSASGSVSIYALINKVVLEPDETAPERIQIWGAFTLAEGNQTLTPQRGYLYFTLPINAAQRAIIVKEWADLKAVAGTGQAVAFGQVGYIGKFADELISRPAGMPPYLVVPTNQSNYAASRNIVRPEDQAVASPDIYITNVGVVKLQSTGNLAAVIETLKAALKK
jgi:hypothetical protein